jgi:hypothetical protein
LTADFFDLLLVLVCYLILSKNSSPA